MDIGRNQPLHALGGNFSDYEVQHSKHIKIGQASEYSRELHASKTNYQETFPTKISAQSTYFKFDAPDERLFSNFLRNQTYTEYVTRLLNHDVSNFYVTSPKVKPSPIIYSAGKK